jgi:hypothetical protein
MNLMTLFNVQSLAMYNLTISSLWHCQSCAVANRRMVESGCGSVCQTSDPGRVEPTEYAIMPLIQSFSMDMEFQL